MITAPNPNKNFVSICISNKNKKDKFHFKLGSTTFPYKFYEILILSSSCVSKVWQDRDAGKLQYNLTIKCANWVKMAPPSSECLPNEILNFECKK